MYLFIFCCTGSWLLHTGFLYFQLVGAAFHFGAWTSHCSGFSSCRAQALFSHCGMSGSPKWQHSDSIAVVCGPQSTQASIVVAHGLSYSTVCGIFPDPGPNLCPLHWQVDSYPLDHQGSPWNDFSIVIYILYLGKSRFRASSSYLTDGNTL